MLQLAYHSTHIRARIFEHAFRSTHVTVRISQHAHRSARIRTRISERAYHGTHVRARIPQHTYQSTYIGGATAAFGVQVCVEGAPPLPSPLWTYQWLRCRWPLPVLHLSLPVSGRCTRGRRERPCLFRVAVPVRRAVRGKAGSPDEMAFSGPSTGLLATSSSNGINGRHARGPRTPSGTSAPGPQECMLQTRWTRGRQLQPRSLRLGPLLGGR